jgi:tetratricopeptide (TPR) repeat protein
MLGYHFMNLALHALSAVMVAIILRRLAVPGALLAAAIFALHPVQAESVAWITEQKNTLSGVFYLGAMLAYLRFDQTRKTSWYLGALGLFSLGMLCKTVIATLPGAMLVIFWWQRGRLSWKNDVLPLAPFLLLGAGGGMVTAAWELKNNGCDGPEFIFTPAERLLLAGRSVCFQFSKLVWPAQLTFIYPRWSLNAHAWWQYLFPLAVATVLVALWAVRRWTRAPLAAALFFVGTLFPVLGFFNLFTFRYSFVADHYQYLACLGIIALASAAAVSLVERWRGWGKLAAYGLCLAMLTTLAGLSFRQSEMYADAQTLYRAIVTRNPDCWMAHSNLGALLANSGKLDEAIVHYKRALEIKPDYAEASYNLGNALADRGEIDEAIIRFRKALEIDPFYAEAHNNLAAALIRVRRFDEAIFHFQKALEINPQATEARANIAVALSLMNNAAWTMATSPESSLRNGAEAVKLAQGAVELSRGQEPGLLGTLAAAYAETGRFPEAVRAARAALELAVKQNKQSLAESIRAKIRLYEAGTPFRESPSPPPNTSPAQPIH